MSCFLSYTALHKYLEQCDSQTYSISQVHLGLVRRADSQGPPAESESPGEGPSTVFQQALQAVVTHTDLRTRTAVMRLSFGCTLESPGELLKLLVSRLHPEQLNQKFSGRTQALVVCKASRVILMCPRVTTTVLEF